MFRALALVLLLLGGVTDLRADTAQLCLFQDASGAFRQVQGRDKVPAAFRKQARCFDPKQAQELAKPEEIDLKGTVRKDSIASALGRIDLRWPRKVELLFGRTPQRAMVEAAAAASRALKRPGFPLTIQNLDLSWQVVFMDEELPEKQIPAYLVSNCHPAWMTPPSNIYVVSQRVVAGCGGGKTFEPKQADAVLAQILIHEIGHAVEAQLLQGSPSDRMQAEGFASWFEQYGAQFSTVILRGSVERYYAELAREAFTASPRVFNFGGSANDYARASMYFKAVEKRKGIRGIAALYSVLIDRKLNLFEALYEEFGWDRERAEREAAQASKS